MKIVSCTSLIHFLLFGILSFGFSGLANATPQAEAELSARADILLQKINEARANPRQALARLGIAEQTAVGVLGSEAWILNQGLPPLVWNAQLQAAALAHGRDMLANRYYNHISPSGLTPTARVAASGYSAAVVDETLAALDFSNYLDPDTALSALFDNMLRDELTGVAGVGRNIFSTSLSEIGIGFLAESVALISAQPNVYLLVLDFSTPGEGPLAQTPIATEAELAAQAYLLWQQINEVRANPRQVMARLGVSEAQAEAALGADAWILDQGLPPLAWSGELQVAAQAHGRDMFANLYYSHLSLSGLDPAARIAATGYEALLADETLAVLAFNYYLPPATVLSSMFNKMLLDELTGTPGVARNIFSTSSTEIGIGFQVENVVQLAGKPNVYLLVLNAAQPLVPRYFVIGRADAGRRVMQRNLATRFWDVVPTLATGEFQLPIGANDAEVVVFDADNAIAARFSTNTLAPNRNQMIDLRTEVAAP